MTNQEAFETVINHLMTQGKPCFKDNNPDNICMYRNENGMKCAIGALIPNDEYRPALEGWSVTELRSHDIEPESIQGMNINFLQELQSLHDEGASFSIQDGDFLDFVKILAKEWGLNTDFLGV